MSLTTAVVLAAGQSKRMRSSLPKVLHRAAGAPLLGHCLAALAPLDIERRVVVVSTASGEVAAAMADAGYRDVEYVVQDPPRGTADAVRVAIESIGEVQGPMLVLPGDAPLLTTATLTRLLAEHARSGAAATLLTATATNPFGYGRVIRSGHEVTSIVEEGEASEDERGIHEINSGVYVFDGAKLADILPKVDCVNSQDECYLTDTVALLRDEGEAIAALATTDEEVAGVNTRAHLATVTALLRKRACERWLDAGVNIVDPSSTFIDASVEIAPEATIHPFCFLEGTTTIGAGAEVGPHARLVDSSIAEGGTVSWAVVKGSVVGPGATVGPFASLREGTRLERGARVGSFVETKKTHLGEGSKANHLTYLGDAEIGRGVNVGAGTITCNWDGTEKHETVIEDDAYIGSDTMIVAPARIGKRAATAAGSVVNRDVPDDALAVGAPARMMPGKGNRMNRPARGEPAGVGEENEEPRQ